MAKQRMIFIVVVCFSIAAFAVQSRQRIPRISPPFEKGMTGEQWRKAIEEGHAQKTRKRLRSNKQLLEPLMREAWKRLLRVTEQQWKIIEPKNKRVQAITSESLVCSKGGGGLNSPRYKWKRHSVEGAKDPHEMSEGEKLADELADLLEDENSKDEEIRKKTDALLQVRAKARAALPQARRELAVVLTTPRQEAVFLLLGNID